MITLYYQQKTGQINEVIERLESLVLAHKQIDLSETPGKFSDLPENLTPPLLNDNGKWISGKSKILKHLQYLESFKQDWDKFQSDSCYCDDEGKIE